ncbi:hypothetical protein HF259_06240 [Rhizobium leguminosarum]|uniref:hypothetical protein n=1 Tax=Rhizobium leguminosarum TaxID=384 RepID=UPI001C927B1B|nr:hypothetical protein [Rhizobium leguminosarum]MBY2921038.1 hypothetical protein [Rhizobium leguminosarum]
MVETANIIWADGPGGSPQQPDKAQIRRWGTWIESLLGAVGVNSGTIFATYAQLQSSLSYPANTMAWVNQDPVASNNGIYRKIGSSGSGSWVKTGDLPYSFITANDAGAGTPNAIQATSDLPINSSALIILRAFEANTGSPVTVSFNGGTPLTVKTASGADVPAAALVANLDMLGRVVGTTFRLVSDIASAAIQAACEAAAAAAADSAAEAAGWAALARDDVVPNTFAGDGATTVFNLSVDPGTEANALVTIYGHKQDLTAYTISGTTLTFSAPPPGNGADHNIEVRMGYRIGVNVPAALSVGSAAIKTSEAADIRTAIDVPSNASMTAAIAAALANSVSGLQIANNATDAANDIDVAAGTILSADGTTMISLPAAVTKQLDATWVAGSGNGGRFDASIADGTWHVFAIGNGTNNYIGFSQSLVPTSAPNYPAGYKYKRVGSVLRVSGSNRAFTQSGMGRERKYLLGSPVVNVSAVASQGTAGVTRSLTVPTGYPVESIATYGISSAPGAGDVMFVSALVQPDVSAINDNAQIRTTSADSSFTTLEILTDTLGRVRTRQAGGGSQEFLTIITRGWKDSI